MTAERKQTLYIFKYINYGLLLMLFVPWFHGAVKLRSVSELKTNATGNLNYSTVRDKYTAATVMATLLRSIT